MRLPNLAKPDVFGLTSYLSARRFGLYVYPREQRTIGTIAGHSGSADSPHAHLRIAAWPGHCPGDPGNLGKRAACRAWRSLPRASTPGRARLDIREVGSFV